MKSFSVTLLTLCVAICTCGTTTADIIAVESFDYGIDTLVAVDATGIGFSTKWLAGGRNTSTSTFRVQTGSLTFAGVESVGNSVTSPSSNTSILGAFRQTNQTFVGANNGQTTWMSFLIRQNSIGGQLGGFGGIYIGNSTSEFNPKLFIGKAGTGPNNWTLENLGGGGQVQSNVAVTTGQTALLVLKMETLAGNDRFTLFVNPSNASVPSVGFVKTDLDLGTADRITMYHAGSFSFDEIRIGTNFSDVITAVPEPSSVLLMLTGAAVAYGTYRKRKP